MADVTLTINGVIVTCAVQDVAAVTAALTGARPADDDGGLRPGERRRGGGAANHQAQVEEFRTIRSKFTDKTVTQVAGAQLPQDGRKRTPFAGDR